MSEPLSIAQVNKLVEDGYAKILHERVGNRPYPQDVIQFRSSHKKFQLTKNMRNEIKPLSKGIKEQVPYAITFAEELMDRRDVPSTADYC